MNLCQFSPIIIGLNYSNSNVFIIIQSNYQEIIIIILCTYKMIFILLYFLDIFLSIFYKITNDKHQPQ